ncbi:hypothetical protein AKJ09_00442 [Labilithrix luteola]|uniref:Uncharacterized protein n=1 Tax=Labilithrix luteola TaxID=1391654 RepID=A0A0K1PJR3_9BACT|nr:hypothetical protein AKJ09_00442 [Labilithrix luteola]
MIEGSHEDSPRGASYSFVEPPWDLGWTTPRIFRSSFLVPTRSVTRPRS